MALVVKVINRPLIQSRKARLAAMLATIHCVRNLVLSFFIGTSVGEGTFGKVKLGKHILTGEKVRANIIFKFKIGSCEDSGERQNIRHGRRGASRKRDPHSEADSPPKHHPAVRDHRDVQAAVLDHGVCLRWGAL